MVHCEDVDYSGSISAPEQQPAKTSRWLFQLASPRVTYYSDMHAHTLNLTISKHSSYKINQLMRQLYQHNKDYPAILVLFVA